jgi:outer membrane protein OmpA-like peptidoglycan-associated protein
LALASQLAAATASSAAEDLLAEDWILDPSHSEVYMQTVKNNNLFETHHFTRVEGSIGKDAQANVKIDLASLDTGLDIRDVRMRFLMFETFKFPTAEISAQLDRAALQALLSETRITYPLKISLSLHGMTQEVAAPVWVTRISDTQVSVASIKPVIITTEMFGLTKNLARLVDVIGGTPIVAATSITFDLVFGSGSLRSQLEAARAAREQKAAAQAAAAITAEACETRFEVMSQTGAIYFKTASADLDRASAPLLDSVADIANRCPAVKINVAGHTDNVGSKPFNQQLSELRARSVVEYLTGKGVAAVRIRSAGYGDTQPVALNNSEANREKNRRIEFQVRKE